MDTFKNVALAVLAATTAALGFSNARMRKHIARVEGWAEGVNTVLSAQIENEKEENSDE